ncbi:periplasmic heavy metal sensor, partial [Candidatus Aerophobetes bacterium]|nr:periplasmic heavy metal sensor [Candidatus Aerophobetes bacterium]
MGKTLNKKILTILLVVALGVFLTGVSFAWKGEYQGKTAAKPRWQSQNLIQERVRWQERLNLTQEQREKIARLRLSFQEDTLDLRNQLQGKRIELQKLWLEENPDKNKIYSILDEIARIRAEIN